MLMTTSNIIPLWTQQKQTHFTAISPGPPRWIGTRMWPYEPCPLLEWNGTKTLSRFVFHAGSPKRYCSPFHPHANLAPNTLAGNTRMAH